MEQHADHLAEGDEAEGDQEHEAEDVQLGRLSEDGDLRRLKIVWSVVCEVVMDPVKTIQILVLEESPPYFQWRVELEHGDQDDVEQVDHKEPEYEAVSVVVEVSPRVGSLRP